MTDVETVVSQQSSYNLADSSAESVSTSAFAAHSRTSSFVSISSPSSVGSLSSSSMGDRTSTTNVEMVAPSVLPIEGERNAKFFFDDDHVTFCVQGLLYRVHGYLFTRESEKARGLIQNNVGSIVILEHVKTLDFDRFLEVLYCRLTDSPPLATQDEWASVLALAHAWDFNAIRGLAIQKLTPLTSAVDKIVLAREHAVVEWLGDSYLAVCEAPKLPSPEECRRLGMDDLIRVIGAWEAMHTRPDVLASRALRLSAFKAVFGPGIPCSAGAEDKRRQAPASKPTPSAPESEPSTQLSPVPPPVAEKKTKLDPIALAASTIDDQNTKDVNALVKDADKLAASLRRCALPAVTPYVAAELAETARATGLAAPESLPALGASSANAPSFGVISSPSAWAPIDFGAPTSSAFGAFSARTPNIFGAPHSGANGAPPPSAFGASPSRDSGAPMTSVFGPSPSGASTGSPFGASPSGAPTASAFGASPSGAPKASRYGASSSGAPTASAFGASPSAAPKASRYGASSSRAPTASAFGAPPSGAPTASAFGASPSSASAASPFGSSPPGALFAPAPSTNTFG